MKLMLSDSLVELTVHRRGIHGNMYGRQEPPLRRDSNISFATLASSLVPQK